ncbi:hypothetical protein DFH07DRAFT_578011 [Mycena maculata]|uniref:F-box domain-containing protein n=1 Tax=Mycena maculata TaxID=230809 RepID=A0AAD7INF7_9AGAR|nr:hypothetical protein DFH07DRAFT_578011 [Mycena maculata]
MASPLPPASAHPPPEIWWLIFRYATESETSYHVDYQPFQPIQELEETSQSLRHESIRLETCLSLMRVSFLFRSLAAEFMYEDVRIFDARGLKSLVSSLAHSEREHGPRTYGSYIRRLELPRRRINIILQSETLPFPTHPIPCDPGDIRLVDVLRFCPNLEILVRPCLCLDPQSVAFWASLVGAPFHGGLPRLMRLEWHETELDTRFYGTGHSDRLREIVSQSPNLRYLFLYSDRQNSVSDLILPRSLHTIRLNRSHFQSRDSRKLLPRPRYCCDIPNFHNLVLHTALPTSLLDFLAVSGHQLRVLEFAFAPQMTFSSNQMQRLLTRCPQLEELAYYLGAPEISPLVEAQCRSLKRVRLKQNPEEWNPCRPVLRTQMEILEGPSFPALAEVILHDPTRWFVRKEMGKDLLRRMRRRGYAVRYEDGSPVPIPA